MRNGSRIVMALAALCLAQGAQAQAYPSKPLRLIVPFPAGGAADITARLIGTKLGEGLGQPMIIENRVGASGFIGSGVVAKAPPDGYTLLLTTPSTHLSAVFLSKTVPYDPVRDFTPIIAAIESFAGLVVGPSVQAKDVRELIDYAKRNPGKLTYTSAGIGSEFHLTGELLKQAAGIDMLHVPYKGAAQALNDVVAGQVSMTLATLTAQLPHVKSGKVRMFGILNGKRFPGLPDVPYVGEVVPGFEKLASWVGFFGPAGLPAPIVDRLNGGIRTALHLPEVRSKLETNGQSIIANTPAEFAATIRNGIEAYGKAVKAAGIKAE